MDGRNIIIGVVGRKGSGKSTKAAELIRRCDRVLIFDTMDEYAIVPNRLTAAARLRQFLAWSDGRPSWAARYVPLGELRSELAAVCELSFAEGRHVLAIEELPGMVAPSWTPPELDRIIRTGRHRNLSVLWTAQRMAEVSRGVTSATDYYVFFAQSEPRDLAALADRCGDKLAGQVARLERHKYLCWDVAARELVSFDRLAGELPRYTKTARNVP